MVLIKIFFSITIIIICTVLGFLYARKYSDRLNNLNFLEQCISILETEIIYGATPLPQALNNVYLKGNKKVSFIFEEIKNDLILNKRGEVIESFSNIREILLNKLQLKEEDVEVFLSLGRVVGCSDRQDQQKNFIIIMNQIKNLQKEARNEKNKNEKMFKNLGILTGCAIVIILM